MVHSGNLSKPSTCKLWGASAGRKSSGQRLEGTEDGNFPKRWGTGSVFPTWGRRCLWWVLRWKMIDFNQEPWDFHGDSGSYWPYYLLMSWNMGGLAAGAPRKKQIKQIRRIFWNNMGSDPSVFLFFGCILFFESVTHKLNWQLRGYQTWWRPQQYVYQ